MAAELKIGAATRLEDLVAWQRAKGEAITFHVNLESSFALGVEGVAVGLLHELLASSRVEVESSFDVVAKDRARGAHAQLGLFDGLFGLALVAGAAHVRVRSSSSSRSEILDCLWRRLRVAQGAIGDGKRLALVSRDPGEPVPECLQAGGTQFPKRDRFAAILFQHARGLGAGGTQRRGYSLTENEAITFIFEAARNSFEHARSDEHGMALKGLRGIILEKVVLGSQAEIGIRSDLSEGERAYIERIWEDLGQAKRILAYTITDFGPGIHRTIQPTSPNEGAWNRLLRSFEPGESRKVKGSDVETGMGLARVRASAARLKALLSVKSADLFGIADFSLSAAAELSQQVKQEPVGSYGTSLTLICPEVDGAGDQPGLF